MFGKTPLIPFDYKHSAHDAVNPPQVPRVTTRQMRRYSLDAFAAMKLQVNLPTPDPGV